MAVRILRSTAIKHGENADEGYPPDDRYVYCGNCHYLANLDRDSHEPYGSRGGDGIKTAETALDGAITTASTTVTVDSTNGFPTPSTGSITAFSAKRLGTTVTSASHGLKGGKVIITGTTNYNGTFPISNVTTNTFDIGINYTADDATGTWTVPEFFYIYDEASDASTGSQSERVQYTGLTSTTFTGCTGIDRAHDDDSVVRAEPVCMGGCPNCGSLVYDRYGEG